MSFVHVGLEWYRERLGDWLPAMAADDPRLLSILRVEGWLPNEPDAR